MIEELFKQLFGVVPVPDCRRKSTRVRLPTRRRGRVVQGGSLPLQVLVLLLLVFLHFLGLSILSLLCKIICCMVVLMF